MLAVIGEVTVRAPQVGETCKLPVFSCNEGFDEMLSHTSQSVYYIHGRRGWNYY